MTDRPDAPRPRLRPGGIVLAFALALLLGAMWKWSNVLLMGFGAILIAIALALAAMLIRETAALYAAGDLMGAGEAANMAKYAAAEACVKIVDQAVQSLGGNGLTTEYGVAPLLALSRIARVAPVSREMVLNFVAQTSLGLPKSY